MSQKQYTRELRIKVAQEATRAENEGMEHIIAEKYGIMPWTVKKWKEYYLEFGEKAFTRGFSSKTKKTLQVIELEKENAELREEVEILKKAAAFLANVKHE